MQSLRSAGNPMFLAVFDPSRSPSWVFFFFLSRNASMRQNVQTMSRNAKLCHATPNQLSIDIQVRFLMCKVLLLNIFLYVF